MDTTDHPADNATAPRTAAGMIADTIKASGERVADATANGMSGLWGKVAQMSAVGVISVSLIMGIVITRDTMREMAVQAHEDRVMFNAAVDSLRRDQQQRSQHVEDVHTRSFERLGDRIEQAISRTRDKP